MELIEEADLAFRRGETDYAARIAGVALDLARKAQDTRREVEALCMLARTALSNGDLDQVAERATEARAKAKGDLRSERLAIHAEAVAARMQGALATARDLYRSSLQLCQSLDDRPTAAAEYRNLAYVEFHAGNRERARKLFLEARRRFEELGDEQFLPYIVEDAALLAIEDGDAPRPPRWPVQPTLPSGGPARSRTPRTSWSRTALAFVPRRSWGRDRSSSGLTSEGGSPFRRPWTSCRYDSCPCPTPRLRVEQVVHGAWVGSVTFQVGERRAVH